MRHKIKSIFAAVAIALSIIFPFHLAQADAGGRSGASPAGVEGSVQIKTGSALGYSDYFAYVIDDETLKVDTVASFSNLYITTGNQLVVTDPGYALDIEGGSGGATSGAGGDVTVRSGGSNGASNAGTITIWGGDANETGNGGDVVLTGGASVGGIPGKVKIGANEVLTTASPVSVSQLNSGTSASSSTYWRGDGAWTTPPYPSVMSATVGGLVPTPPNNTTTFLRGDGTFAAAGGGGLTGVTNGASGTPNGYTALGDGIAPSISGAYNTFIGAQAGAVMTNGTRNTALGWSALWAGAGAMLDNTAVGYYAGGSMTGASALYNTVIGAAAGSGITSGASNTMIGKSAGEAVTTGGKNTYIGRYTGTGFETSSNRVFISDGDGNIRIQADNAGRVSLINGGSANKAVCWMADGKALGYCSTAPDAGGVCTCN